MTSRSCPTFLQSQIFYVRTFAGYLLPNRGFQLLPCPAVLSVSALRAGALALAPTFTGLRAGRGAGLAWRPVRAPPHSRGDKAVPWPRFHAESGWNNVPRKAGKWAAQEAALEEIGQAALEEIGQVRSRLRCRSAEGHTRIK